MFKLLLLISVPVWAGPTLKPGEYVEEGVREVIRFAPLKDGALPFSIEAYGANGHQCGAEGTLKLGELEARLETSAPPDVCVLKFSPKPNGVTLEASPECHSFCGARAWIGGDHQLAPAQCEQAKINTRYDEFLQLYKKKKYGEAKKKISALREECDFFMSRFRKDEMRNDLAITLHHLKDDAGCLEVLQPLKQLAQMSDEDIKEENLPVEAVDWLAIAKAARTNLKLCKGGKK